MDLDHDPQLLTNFLTPNELENIPPEIQKKLQKYVNDILDEYCKHKVAANRLADIELRNEDLQSHIQDYDVKIQNYEQNIAELRLQLDTVSSERLQLMEKASNYDQQFIQQRNERAQFIEERDNLLKLTEHQKDEIERLQSDNRMFKQQLKNAISAKCEAIARVDEIESKETTFEYKERRFEQEREILQSQIRTLSQDLNRNVMDLQNFRRENTLHTVKLETCLSEKEAELKIAQNQCNQYKETIEQLTENTQELSQKILKQNEDAQKMMDYYKKELDAKTKLAELYKSNCDDTDVERNELTTAIADLKRMLSDASDQYGELETTHKATLLSHEQQLDELNKIIAQLRLDLKNANDFLQKTQKENIDEAVAKLAPTAAIASRLLRSDMSLTDIYSLYVKTSDDLEREKCEHAQVQLQLKQILEELNENAPIYKKRDFELKCLNKTYLDLKEQYEQLISEKIEVESKLQELQKANNTLDRENTRLQSTQGDLNRQVCCLLKEVEELRTGLMPKPVNKDNMAEMNGDNSCGSENGSKMADKILSKTIVTFTSIVELQANNQKLLLLIRDLTRQLESAEQFRKEINDIQYLENIERYSRKVKQMEDMLHEREEAFKSILTKCERYKKLYFYLQKKLNTSEDTGRYGMSTKKRKIATKEGEENNQYLEEDSQDERNNNIDDHDTDDIESLIDTESLDNEDIKSLDKPNLEHKDNDTNKIDNKRKINEIKENIQKEYKKRIHDLQQQLDLFKDQYNTQKEQFEYYTKEKKNNEKMLHDQCDSMREEVRQLMSKNANLLSTLEYNKEQIKLQQKNVATYKQQIRTLEERCKNYEGTIIKHEQTLIYLKDEAMKASHNHSSAESEAEHLRHDNQMLKDSITRLQIERDSYHREQQNQSLLLNNLELIKSNLERSEMEGRIRLEQRLDETVRELSAQRRRFQEEEDRFREIMNDLKRQSDTANQELTNERKEMEKLTEVISSLRSELTIKTQKIDELSKKLQTSLTPSTGDNPIVAANKRAREFELKYENISIEIESMKKDLTKAREHAQQYYKMSQSAETEIKNMHDVHTSFVTKAENEIKELQKINLNQKSHIIDLEARLELFTINKKVTTDQNEEENKLKEKLKDALQKLSECSSCLNATRTENTKLSESLHNVESKYANEMLLHSADLKQLSDIKVELSKVQEKIDTLTGERDKLRTILNEEKRSTDNSMEIMKKEQTELENRIKDLNELNSHLHNQIEGLTTKLTVLSQSAITGTNTGGNASVSVLNESKQNVMDTSMNSGDGSLLCDDNAKNNDQLLQIMKYLRKEKDVTMAKLDILKAENVRVQSERNILQKKCEELQNCLNQERSKTDVHLVSTSKHEEILRKIETINAITDSNRVLREERNTLNERCKELNERISKLETELFPLQKQNCELSGKIDELTSENTSLRTEAMKWRQRANVLVEKSNKNPEEFKRLQNERDNLTKILTNEREQHKQLTDEMNAMKSERERLNGEMTSMERQNQTLSEEKKICSNELLSVKQNTTRLMQEIMELRSKLMQKEEAMQKSADDLEAKEQQLQESKNKEFQIRKIAKRYKDSYLDLMNRTSGNAGAGVAGSNVNSDATVNANDNTGNINSGTGNNSGMVGSDNSDLTGTAGTLSTATINDASSGFSSSSTLNTELQQNRKTIENLNNIIRTMQEDCEKVRKNYEDLKTSVELDERTKFLLREAKIHIVGLTNSQANSSNELATIKKKLVQSNEEHEQVVNEYKRKHDEAMLRLEREQVELNRNKEELIRMQRENESLTMRINQLNRQLGMQQASKPSTSSGAISEKSGLSESSPRTANVKPMSGSTSVQQSATVTPWRAGETPLASIRPISVQNMTRTAAILPTTQQVTTVSGVVVAGTTSSTSSTTPSSASSATSGAGICTSALTSSSSIISASTSSSVSTISTSSSTTLSSTSTSSSALTSSSSTSSSTLSSISSSLTTPLSSSTSSLTSSTSTSSSAVTASGSSNTALVPPQQQVHTTAGNVALESMSSSSPTSSHADYMPSTSTSASSVAVAAIPPMGSTTAAESSQEAESVQQQHIHHHQQQQQQLHHHQQMKHQPDVQGHVVSGLGTVTTGAHGVNSNMGGTSGVVVSNASNNVTGGSGMGASCSGSSLGVGQQIQAVALVSPRVEGSTQSSQMSSGINALQMMQQEGVAHLHHQQQQQPSTSGTSSGVSNLHINVSSHSRHTPSSSNVTTTQSVAAGPSSVSGHKRARDHDGDFSSSSTTTTTTISSGSEVDQQQDKKHIKLVKRMRSLTSALHHEAAEAAATQILSGNIGGIVGIGSGNAGCDGIAGGSGIHAIGGVVGAGSGSGGLGGATVGVSSGRISAGVSAGGISDSGMDVDQMPTSSQRDQEDDVVVVDSDDDDDVDDDRAEDEEDEEDDEEEEEDDDEEDGLAEAEADEGEGGPGDGIGDHEVYEDSYDQDNIDIDEENDCPNLRSVAAREAENNEVDVDDNSGNQAQCSSAGSSRLGAAASGSDTGIGASRMLLGSGAESLLAIDQCPSDMESGSGACTSGGELNSGQDNNQQSQTISSGTGTGSEMSSGGGSLNSPIRKQQGSTLTRQQKANLMMMQQQQQQSEMKDHLTVTSPQDSHSAEATAVENLSIQNQQALPISVGSSGSGSVSGTVATTSTFTSGANTNTTLLSSSASGNVGSGSSSMTNATLMLGKSNIKPSGIEVGGCAVSMVTGNMSNEDIVDFREEKSATMQTAGNADNSIAANVAATATQSQLPEVQQSTEQITAAASSAGSSGENEGTDGVSSEGEKKAVEEIEEEGREAEASTSPSVNTRSKGVVARGISNVGRRPLRTTGRVGNRPTPIVWQETSGTSRNADMQNSRNIIPIQDPLMAAGRAGFTPHRILRGRRLRRPAGNFPNTRYP